MPIQRLALNGQTYQARTVAAAAQSCINIYPEKIEDPQETEKGTSLTIGCPGKHLFKDLTTISGAAHPVRGFFSGGGRVFVAAGTNYFEINSSGGLVGPINTIADDAAHSPVLMFANGNQLFIISAGKAYIDNGAGPQQIEQSPNNAVVSALDYFLTWTSGDKFAPGMVGQNVTLNFGGGPLGFVVANVFNDTELSLTTSTGFVVPTSGTFEVFQDMVVSSGCFGDGYFMASIALTRRFQISALNDGTNASDPPIWNSLDSGIKESYPDYIQSILWSNEQLYLFGTESGEVWQNIGSQVVNGVATFPFQRIDGATFKYGSVSPNGPIAIGGQVFFLGGDSTGQTAAYRLNGFTPVKISTPAIENAWNNALLGSTAVSASYLEEGHTFWEISFGTGQMTWVYDLTTGAWHQRATGAATAYGPYGRQFHTFVTNSASAPTNDWGAGGKHLVGGDGTTGKIYEQSLNFYDDDGADIARQRAVNYLYNGGNRIYYGRNNLDMETGTVASGSAPNVVRDYSDDRGQTFSNPQTASLGVHNDFDKRVFWPPSGSSYGRVYRYTITGQSKVALVNCDIDLVKGTN